MALLIAKILVVLTLQLVLGFSLFRKLQIGKNMREVYQVFAVSLGLGYLVTVIISLVLSIFPVFNIKSISLVSLLFVLVCNYDILQNKEEFYENLKNIFREMRKTDYEELVLFLFLVFIIVYPVYGKIVNVNAGGVVSIGYVSGFRKIVESHGFIKTVSMYGIEIEYPTDKIGVTLFSAFMSLYTSSDYLVVYKVLTVYFVLWLIMNVFLYLRYSYNFKISLIGLGFIIINNFFNGLILGKFNTYRAESAGIILLFLNLYLYLEWRKSKNARIGIVSILVSSMQAITHLASFIPFCLFTGSHFIYELYKTRKLGHIKDFTLHYVMIIVIIAVIMVSLGSYPEYLIGMDETKYSDIDLTYEFRSALSGDPSLQLSNESYHEGPVMLFQRMITSASRSSGFLLSSTHVMFYIILFSSLGFYITKKKNHEILVPSIIFIFVLYAFGYFFSQLFNTWAYSTFSERRLFPYIFLSLVNLPLTLLDNDYKLNLNIKNSKRDLNEFIVYAVLILVLLFAPSYGREMSGRINSVISPDAFETLNWLKTENGEANVLLNVRTTGVFSLIAGCDAVFGGKATYFEPELTSALVELINEAKEFYLKPDTLFLAKHNITHIIVLTDEDVSFAGNIITPIEVDLEILENTSFLEKVKVFGSVHVFKVVIE